MAVMTLTFKLIHAQSASDELAHPVTTMSVQVKVVNVHATARDTHGRIVNNLTQMTSQSAKTVAQTICYFARETDMPLILGLLVDTSISQRRVRGEERSASQSFLVQMLREDKDKAFVVHFDREVELLQDLTSSHEKLRTALQSLEAPQFARASGGNSPGAGGTTLYDAVYLANLHSARTQWSIPFSSRMTKPTATEEALAEPGWVSPAWGTRYGVEAWVVLAGVGAGIPSSTRTARKS
jgi:hypothetical protein